MCVCAEMQPFEMLLVCFNAEPRVVDWVQSVREREECCQNSQGINNSGGTWSKGHRWPAPRITTCVKFRTWGDANVCMHTHKVCSRFRFGRLVCVLETHSTVQACAKPNGRVRVCARVYVCACVCVRVCMCACEHGLGARSPPPSCRCQ